MQHWILYIDDDQDDRDMFMEVCGEVQPGIDCVAVKSGSEGLKKMEMRESPLCIYLDINMPGMEGLDVLRVLKEHPVLSAIPAFILSATRNEKLEAEAKSIGAADYLQKPVSYQGYLALLRSCLTQHFELRS